ncbi:MAG TPA: cupredoxin domain-containing protein [Dehalococcoidia bacterium]|nr:cupredoxin domain-containing protein [Dehalococcoidia bacterium]
MNRRPNKTLKSMAILVALTAGVIAVAAACGGGDNESKTSTPAASRATVGPVSLDLSMGDNFFDQNGKHNPTLEIPAGATVEIKLTNKGSAIHNMRFAGDDNKYNSGDDAVSDPALLPGGQTGVIKFTAPKSPGTYTYQCDYHPTDSKGEITVK